MFLDGRRPRRHRVGDRVAQVLGGGGVPVTPPGGQGGQVAAGGHGQAVRHAEQQDGRVER